MRQLVRNERTGELDDIGQCLADGHLNNRLDPVPGPPMTFPNAPSTTDALVFEEIVGPEATHAEFVFPIVAAIIEFDVAGLTELTIRTTVSLDGSYGAFGGSWMRQTTGPLAITIPNTSEGPGVTRITTSRFRRSTAAE